MKPFAQYEYLDIRMCLSVDFHDEQHVIQQSNIAYTTVKHRWRRELA